MDNQKRIIRETARRTGLTAKEVTPIVVNQLRMVKESMVGKKPVSIYLRQVGTFISPEVKYALIGKRLKHIFRQKKQKEVEEPYEFK